MQFGYTIVYVPEVESTINFYKNAFNLEEHFLHESKQYGELNTGNTKIAFASNSLAEANGVSFIENDKKNTAPGIEIAFITHDVKQAYKHAIDHGATIVKAPSKKPWGQEVAYLRDINGIIVELCSPMG
jgi:lactoylglutathione lyase